MIYEFENEDHFRSYIRTIIESYSLSTSYISAISDGTFSIPFGKSSLKKNVFKDISNSLYIHLYEVLNEYITHSTTSKVDISTQIISAYTEIKDRQKKKFSSEIKDLLSAVTALEKDNSDLVSINAELVAENNEMSKTISDLQTLLNIKSQSTWA